MISNELSNSGGVNEFESTDGKRQTGEIVNV